MRNHSGPALRKVVWAITVLAAMSAVATARTADAASKQLYVDPNGGTWCGDGQCTQGCCEGDRIGH